MNVFDIIKNINSSDKTDLMREGDDKFATEAAYVPFIVNRGLSYFADTVLYANEMNKGAVLSKQQQYDFFRLSIRPGKRWSKWYKAEENADLDLVMRVYNYSPTKAAAALKLLNNHQLDELRKREFEYKGGVQK